MARRVASFMLSNSQARLLALVKAKPRLTYEDMSAALGVDRRTVIISIKVLERKHRLVVERPGGGQPNRYIPTDPLLLIDPLGL